MRIVRILPSFEKCLKRRTSCEKSRIRAGLRGLNRFLVTGQPSKGFGLRKLAGTIYELRADLHLRILISIEGDMVYLLFAGNHDEIRRFLKSVR